MLSIAPSRSIAVLRDGAAHCNCPHQNSFMYSVTTQVLRKVADKQVQRQDIHSMRSPVCKVDDGVQTRGSIVTDVDKLRLLLPAAETHSSQTEMFLTRVSSAVCL